MKHTVRLFCPSSTFFPTYLKWPLQLDVRLSPQLLNVENHWKDRINYVRPKLDQAPTKYVLAMFPYPSGRLHMGHLRVYSISDVCARYYALKGFSVIHPIGWDAFGLPAENAAFQHSIDPKIWTYENIDVMRKQLKKTGINFDWDREILTCESNFFKWTQFIFIQLHKHGLARRTLAEVFWDPVDRTVLAAEQVDADGHSWRSGAIAEKRKLHQWVIETPKFAKRMSDGLKLLRYDWGEIANIQANWIGTCDVYRFLLPIKKNNKRIEELFDLRLIDPTKLVNSQFLIITAKHSLATSESKNKTLKNENYLLDGTTVFNFVNNTEMPIVVLSGENQKSLADSNKQFFMESRLADTNNCDEDAKIAQHFLLPYNSFSKHSIDLEAIQAMAKNKNYGGYLTSRTLRDWVVSRQRRWGTPIPMLLDVDNVDAPISVDEAQLPIQLEQRGKKVLCNKFASGFGLIEADTLDTFFDSSWYFLRYLDPRNEKELASRQLLDEGMPVNIYVGGVEHADVHMFFARFISYFLHDIGILSVKEPFRRLIPQGIVRGPTFRLVDSDVFVKPDDVVELKDSGIFHQKFTGHAVSLSFEKMSKSKLNGIDSLKVIETDGCDLVRLQLLDAASPREPISWGKTQTSDLRGLKRFIDRCASVVSTYVDGRQRFGFTTEDSDLVPKLDERVEQYYCDLRNDCSRKISVAIEVTNVHNTAIENLQIFASALKKMDARTAGRSVEFEKSVHALVIMLQVFFKFTGFANFYVFAPHIASELWSALQTVEKISSDVCVPDAPVGAQNWPVVDADALIDFVVCLNGKTVKCEERRPIIEPLLLNELVDLARNKYHAHLFQLLDEKQLEISEFQLEKRLGMQITLYVILKYDVKESLIIDILQKIRKKKLANIKTKKKNNKLLN